jgi:hypothetical protein
MGQEHQIRPSNRITSTAAQLHPRRALTTGSHWAASLRARLGRSAAADDAGPLASRPPASTVFRSLTCGPYSSVSTALAPLSLPLIGGTISSGSSSSRRTDRADSAKLAGDLGTRATTARRSMSISTWPPTLLTVPLDSSLCTVTRRPARGERNCRRG